MIQSNPTNVSKNVDCLKKGGNKPLPTTEEYCDAFTFYSQRSY